MQRSYFSSNSFGTQSIVCLCVVALGISLPGCSNSSKPSGDRFATGEKTKKPKIALIMKSLANEFFSTMAEGAKTHQAANAEQYELIVNGIKDERDVSRQVALVDEMVGGGVDAIVIAPADSKALIPVLRRAMQAGVVVINIDNKLDAKQLETEQLHIPFVGPDNRDGAKLVGDYLATKLTSGDAVAMLEGLQTSENGRLRKEGFEESMKSAGMKIVDSQSAQWEMSKANSIASSMLAEHPEIKAILAANDSMAMGAMAAAKSAGREKDLMIVGFDNIAAVQEAIRGGRILATADQHGDQLAVFGVETALKSLADKQSKPVDVQTPIDLITADSLK
jgi:ribose transport system substrate-binding protein